MPIPFARQALFLVSIALFLFLCASTSMDAPQQTDSLPKAAIVYSSDYLIDLGGYERMHSFDIHKYKKIYQQLVADKLLNDDQTHQPDPINEEQIKLVHNAEFLKGLQDKQTVSVWLEATVLASLPVDLDAGVLQKFRNSSGGTLLASRLALESGIGINIGGGYHHAKPDKGEGFCIYADVPIAIRQLQKDGLIQRAVIIDVDAHQGNGTAVCFANDDDVFTFSMHQQDIYPVPKETSDLDIGLDAGTDDQAFLDKLKQHLTDVLDRANADICFVVGGCDTLKGDPLAALEMTPAGIVERDELIVRACVERELPVVFTLSGGYSDDAWQAQYLSIKNLLEKFGLAERKGE